MKRARVVADLVLAALAGAGISSLLSALLWPVLLGWTFLDVKIVLASVGIVLIGFFGAGLASAAAALRARFAGRVGAEAVAGMRAAAFHAALLVGLGTLLGAWLFHLYGFHAGVRYGVLSGLALSVFVPIPAPRCSWVRAMGVISLLGLAALYSGVGYSERLIGNRLQVPEDLQPLPEAAAEMRVGSGPDVLLISVDTLRADEFLDPSVPTPHLDALRAGSLWADYARAPAPSTLPSHVTMMTGEHPLDTGCYTNNGFMHAKPGSTLPEVFREAGWRAIATVSNGVLSHKSGFARGFEAFSNLESYDSELRNSLIGLMLSTRRMAAASLLFSDNSCLGVSVRLTHFRTNVPNNIHITYTSVGASTVGDAALAYLDQLYAQERPWFFFLHFIDPHLPYAPAVGVAGTLTAGSVLPERYAEFPRLTTLLSNAVQDDLGSENAAVRADALAAVAHMRRAYGEELMAVDVEIGRVMERATRSGRPLVVLFTSDHGEHFGEFNEMSHGNTLYEEVLRVPFALSGPGIAPGRLESRPLLEDVGLTLLHAAGIPVTTFGRGRDLLQPPSGSSAPIFAAHENLLAVLDGGWKAIYSWDTEDPRESPLTLQWGSRSDQEGAGTALEPEITAKLLQLAEEARRHATKRAKRALSEAERADFAALGYAFDAEGNLIDK